MPSTSHNVPIVLRMMPRSACDLPTCGAKQHAVATHWPALSTEMPFFGRRCHVLLPHVPFSHRNAPVPGLPCANTPPSGLRRTVRRANVGAMKRARAMNILLGEARRSLGMTQAEFGSAVGGSHRSAVRWDAAQATPGVDQLHRLARLLHSRDRALAAEVAEAAGETLESLGLEAPPAPAPATPAASLPPAPAAGPRPEDLVDILVLVAFERIGSPPNVVRPLLHAVFKRALDVGLTVEAAEKALRPQEPEAARQETDGRASTAKAGKAGKGARGAAPAS
jgi:transcriptional regulator with XRE-family HTH domain